MKKVSELLAAGRLKESIDAAVAELRNNPINTQLRTLLFELLCFAGEWDRAEKHLAMLSDSDRDHRIGALLYLAAIQAERTRHEMFLKNELPTDTGASAATNAIVNGVECAALEDVDERLGARLEVFAGGSYMWIPFTQIASISIPPPVRLRDLLWAPAVVNTTSEFRGGKLGEVLLPVLYPFTWQQPSDEVRLGRMTSFSDTGIPYGQRLLAAGDHEFALLEIRSLEIRAATEVG